MNGSCEEVRPLLDAYQDDELSSADRRRVERHLAGCAACRAVLLDLAGLEAALRADSARTEPRGDYFGTLDERLKERFDFPGAARGWALPEAGLRGRPRWRGIRPLVAARLALGIAAVAAVALVIRIVQESPVRPFGSPGKNRDLAREYRHWEAESDKRNETMLSAAQRPQPTAASASAQPAVPPAASPQAPGADSPSAPASSPPATPLTKASPQAATASGSEPIATGPAVARSLLKRGAAPVIPGEVSLTDAVTPAPELAQVIQYFRDLTAGEKGLGRPGPRASTTAAQPALVATDSAWVATWRGEARRLCDAARDSMLQERCEMALLAYWRMAHHGARDLFPDRDVREEAFDPERGRIEALLKCATR